MNESASNVRNPQWNTLGSGRMVSNDTTNNRHDHSQGKTTDNSTNSANYYDSNHYHNTYTTLSVLPGYMWGWPSAPAGRRPIDILQELICAGAMFDSAERSEPPRCHPETRTATLTSCSSWVDDLNALCLFMWITGRAGIGKSAILQTLAELYSNSGRLSASFFFLQANQNQNTIRGFVATIAKQLMDSIPATREIILQKIADNPTIFVEKSFDGLWRTLVVSTLRHPTVAPPIAPMLIVVDGIDEITSSEEQCTLLRTILRSMPRLGSSYKFLIASRPEQHIEGVFREFGISRESRIELGTRSGDSRPDVVASEPQKATYSLGDGTASGHIYPPPHGPEPMIYPTDTLYRPAPSSSKVSGGANSGNNIAEYSHRLSRSFPSSVHGGIEYPYQQPPQRRYPDPDHPPPSVSTSTLPSSHGPSDQMVVPGSDKSIVGRNARRNDNLICPPPVFSNQRRTGWFNRRGDQLWTNDGLYKPPPPGKEYPPDLDGYPEYGQGWQDEEGTRIDMKHHLIPNFNVGVEGGQL